MELSNIKPGMIVKIVGNKGECSSADKRCYDCVGDNKFLKVLNIDMTGLNGRFVNCQMLGRKSSHCNFHHEDLIPQPISWRKFLNGEDDYYV